MTTTAVEYGTQRRLELAQDQLQSVDLRTLKGAARQDVKEARVAVAQALRSVKAHA